MKKIKNFIIKNRHWILLTVLILFVLAIFVIPFGIYMARCFWELALNTPVQII